MEQNSQNGTFYPNTFNLHHHAFNSAHERSSQGSPLFLPPGYSSPGFAPPSAPSSASQGFHMMDSVHGLDYGKPQEQKNTSNIVTVAASDSTTKTNAENFSQALEGVSQRLSKLENIVQGLECSIEGLKCAEKEKHNENNDKLARLELLIKEVLTGVQHLNESQKLDGAISKMRKLQVIDAKPSVGEEVSVTEGGRHPSDCRSNLEPSETSEKSTQHVTVCPSPPHFSEAPPPPQAQNYMAPHNILPQIPSMSEPGKLTAQHPYPPPLQPPVVPPSNGQVLPPHHSMQVPSFPYHASLSLPAPPPHGLSNPTGEATSYGHMHLHQQYSEPPRPPINGFLEFRQYNDGVHQEVPHSSPPYGASGSHHVYESAAGMAGATPVFVPPYVQSRPQSPSPVSMYETINGSGFNNGPSYRAAPLVPSITSGGGSHSALPKVQPSPASNGMPVGSVLPSRHQINEVTEKVVAMGFPREQVRATVEGLTAAGQPVDMNAVLDKLMNNIRGASPQLQRGWYN